MSATWRAVEHVEAATLHWVDWFDQHRLLEVNGELSPIELERAHYGHVTGPTETGESTNRVSRHRGRFIDTC